MKETKNPREQTCCINEKSHLSFINNSPWLLVQRANGLEPWAQQQARWDCPAPPVGTGQRVPPCTEWQPRNFASLCGCLHLINFSWARREDVVCPQHLLPMNSQQGNKALRMHWSVSPHSQAGAITECLPLLRNSPPRNVANLGGFLHLLMKSTTTTS